MSLLVVTVAATATRLADPALVKGELGITDTSQDIYIATLVDQASAAVANFCNRVFAQETVQETFSRRAGDIAGRNHPLLLTRFPVVTVASVVADGDTLDPTADYEADLARGRLFRLDDQGEDGTWWAKRAVVTYTAGWLLPLEEGRTLPADVERACVLLAVAMYLAKGRDPGVTSENVFGVGSQNYGAAQTVSGLPPVVAGLLANYRLSVSG